MSAPKPPKPEPEPSAWDRFLAGFPFYYLLIATALAVLCALLLPYLRGVVR